MTPRGGIYGDGQAVANPNPSPRDAITFWYRNYKGEVGYRRVRPLSIRYGTSEWHPEKQWLMRGYDTVNDKEREFAMKDMSDVIGNPAIELGLIKS